MDRSVEQEGAGSPTRVGIDPHGGPQTVASFPTCANIDGLVE